METNENTRRYILHRKHMKRTCRLCLNEYRYANVKKYGHGLQLCTKCQDVIIGLCITADSFVRH